jgi:uncharacterized protein YdaU (DUF1376 family)
VNYYERHLGDYARDAGHLSMLEHGAYTLLLDRYYTTERGIPADQAHRVCRARTREEREAVDTVLAEFFTLEDGCWVNGRATREVTKMQAKVKAAQENGKRGGRPKATKTEPNGNPPGSESVTQPKAHQSPDTNGSEANASDGAAAPARVIDSKAALWRESVLVLQAGGCENESLCRSFMGKLVKDYTEATVREAVTAAISAQPADAREYLKATCQRLKGERKDPITVPSTDTGAEKFKAAMDERAATATKPPAAVLELARKSVRTA